MSFVVFCCCSYPAKACDLHDALFPCRGHRIQFKWATKKQNKIRPRRNRDCIEQDPDQVRQQEQQQGQEMHRSQHPHGGEDELPNQGPVTRTKNDIEAIETTCL